jgi:cell wall-associated NlpC family hydrolase
VLPLAAGASAHAQTTSTATGATLGEGVSSVTWALGILDPHVDLGALRGQGSSGAGGGTTLTVSATSHPVKQKQAAAHHAGHVVAPPSGGKLPPASAGTNGTDIARNAGQLDLTSRDAFDFGSQSGGGPTTTLVGGIAIPPASAPPAIQAAVDAANSISTTPYVWGGGHASFNSRGYDCSGAVSFALHGAGFLSQPLASGQLMNWGVPGPGKWLTVYASPGHAYAVIAGLRWDTVGDAQGTGPRWHPEGPYPAGFVARHFPGY